MELNKKLGAAFGIVTGVLGANAEKVESIAREAMTSVASDESHSLEQSSAAVKQIFGEWQERINALTELRRTGLLVKEIRPIHISVAGLSAFDHSPRAHFKVILSSDSGRDVSTILNIPLAEVGTAGNNPQQPLVDALDRVAIAEVVEFASRQGLQASR